MTKLAKTDRENGEGRGAGVETLRGVGATRGRQLRGLGVGTLGELVEYFPRDYQYESSELAISGVVGEQIQVVRGEVVAVDYVPARPRPRFEATIEDGTGKMGLVWFYGQYLRRQIHPGMTIRVRGKVSFFKNIPRMTQPKWEAVDATTETIEQSKFRAIYPATARLTSEAIEGIVEQNLEAGLECVEEWFEPGMLERRGMMGRREAYRAIHRPKDIYEAMKARRRIVYDELMLMQLGLGLSRKMRDGRLTAAVVRIDKLLDERIRRRFVFGMTGAQQRATWEIVRDMHSGRPMNRLLQGDVGSGKTAVAVYAMLVAVANKLQAAILAPTEVLAEQHYLTLKNLLGGSNVVIELFTSRTRRQKKTELLRRLAEGEIHLAVGTQALIQEDIEFANLGLVVVDEQHKLGVRQRGVLKSKGLAPHYLVMTATPIPRTLALSYFADFDVSVIDELPPGRQPIKTRWLRPGDAGKAHAFLREQVEAGRQAYVVLPQIDDDGMAEAKSVLKEYERLGKGPLHGLRLAMLHGQMTTEEKQATMTRFRDGAIDVLVATTVIEVGIDVPNATVILIDNADRFGLSQLHQLRGRVGRGSETSYCILLADAMNETTEDRLRAMTQTNNGFEIAEMDLKLRGPGEFFGTRQHGLPEFKLADVRNEMELLSDAKDDAMELLGRDPKLTEHRALRGEVARLFGDSLGLASVG